MLLIINNFFMVITITIGVFLMTRYVFLEPGMEPEKQRIFYIASFALIIVLSFVLPDNTASAVSILLGALNIVLGRKKYRLAGALLILPLTGIMDGIAAPIILLGLLSLEETQILVWMLVMYGLIATVLLFFYFKGKKWRGWFAENMKNRRPRVSEYIVLCLSGIALLIANNLMAYFLDPEKLTPESEKMVMILIVSCNLIAFMLAITVIVLIMQGNRRKFYHDRVSSMQFHMIATMADIVENRDANTGGHIRRTAKYVEIIGKNLKKRNMFSETLTDQYLADMIVAAPLHDIGKISIPDAILNKPGKLEKEEFEIMKTHAAAGRDVLRKAERELGEFNYLNIAQDMAEYHHEWWNGKGYPQGISGEEIPLCARIMAVADVFDALTSKRCYKAAMPLEKAYGIIKEELGTHFDPIVAETFLNAGNEIGEVMREMADEAAESGNPSEQVSAG